MSIYNHMQFTSLNVSILGTRLTLCHTYYSGGI